MGAARRGFTMIEITSVMGIVAILFTVGAPAMVTTMTRRSGVNAGPGLVATVHQGLGRQARWTSAKGRIYGYTIDQRDGQWQIRPWYGDVSANGRILAPVHPGPVDASALIGNGVRWSSDAAGQAYAAFEQRAQPTGAVSVLFEPGTGFHHAQPTEPGAGDPVSTTVSAIPTVDRLAFVDATRGQAPARAIVLRQNGTCEERQ